MMRKKEFTENNKLDSILNENTFYFELTDDKQNVEAKTFIKNLN